LLRDQLAYSGLVRLQLFKARFLTSLS
jgi:hypothetical protein